jgi:hypothetical protein
VTRKPEPDMQSYIQSRRIAHAVQSQIERDLEKAQLITRRNTPVVVGEDDTEKIGGQSSTVPAPQGHGVFGRRHSQTETPAEVLGETNTALRESRRSSETGESGSDTESVTMAHRIQTTATTRTQYTARAALGHSMTGVQARDRRTHEGKGEQVFVVDWEGPDDPMNPRNWTIAKRIGCTMQISLIAATVGAASGIDATVLPQAAADLGVSDVAESLCTGKYLFPTSAP